MDIARMVSELRQELENLDAAIWTLERLQQSGPRRRGRPPKSALGAAVGVAPPEPEDGAAEVAAAAAAAALRRARRRP